MVSHLVGHPGPSLPLTTALDRLRRLRTLCRPHPCSVAAPHPPVSCYHFTIQSCCFPCPSRLRAFKRIPAEPLLQPNAFCLRRGQNRNGCITYPREGIQLEKGKQSSWIVKWPPATGGGGDRQRERWCGSGTGLRATEVVRAGERINLDEREMKIRAAFFGMHNPADRRVTSMRHLYIYGGPTIHEAIAFLTKPFDQPSSNGSHLFLKKRGNILAGCLLRAKTSPLHEKRKLRPAEARLLHVRRTVSGAVKSPHCRKK